MYYGHRCDNYNIKISIFCSLQIKIKRFFSKDEILKRLSEMDSHIEEQVAERLEKEGKRRQR